MRLLHVATLRFSLLAALLTALWSVFFYHSMIDEINDETDDALEDYAKTIITRSLRGETIPQASPGSNNQYFRRNVTADYARSVPAIRYADREVYIKDKGEREPARVITYIYSDAQGRYYELEVSTPNIDKGDLATTILLRVTLLYLVLLFSLIVLNAWGMRRVMRPLYMLLDWLSRYKLGENRQHLKLATHIREFRILAEAVNETMERGENLYARQQLFVGNASHEMQTPLSICIARIEHLMTTTLEKLTEEEMRELLKTKQTLEALSQLNRSLLLLCRIENEDAAKVANEADTGLIDLAQLVRQLLPDYEEVYASRSISTAGPSASARFTVQMSRSLAQALVANLIKNAFIHNYPGGRVEIECSPQCLTFRNTGYAKALDPERVFETFYHGDNAQRTSNGLGLAIVRAIARRYQLQAGYLFEKGMHTFEIRK